MISYRAIKSFIVTKWYTLLNWFYRIYWIGIIKWIISDYSVSIDFCNFFDT